MSLYLLLGFLHDEAGRLRRDISPLALYCTAVQSFSTLIEKQPTTNQALALRLDRDLTKRCRIAKSKCFITPKWYVSYPSFHLFNTPTHHSSYDEVLLGCKLLQYFSESAKPCR